MHVYEPPVRSGQNARSGGAGRHRGGQTAAPRPRAGRGVWGPPARLVRGAPSPGHRSPSPRSEESRLAGPPPSPGGSVLCHLLRAPRGAASRLAPPARQPWARVPGHARPPAWRPPVSPSRVSSGAVRSWVEAVESPSPRHLSSGEKAVAEVPFLLVRRKVCYLLRKDGPLWRERRPKPRRPQRDVPAGVKGASLGR